MKCKDCIHYDICRDECIDKLVCSEYKNKDNYITVDEAIRRALSACHGITQFDALEIAEAIEGVCEEEEKMTPEYKMCSNESMAIYILKFIKRGYEYHYYEGSGVLKYLEALQMGIDALRKQKEGDK